LKQILINKKIEIDFSLIITHGVRMMFLTRCLGFYLVASSLLPRIRIYPSYHYHSSHGNIFPMLLHLFVTETKQKYKKTERHKK